MSRPLLQIVGLKKRFPAPDGTLHTVLDIPEFALESDSQVALEGESGAGKTTLLNVIAGISRADEGEVWLDGHDLTRLSESERDSLRARILGYVFQTFNLLQGYTALENVVLGMTFGPGPDRKQAAELLDQLGMRDRLHHRPRQLSVGQQQRVALARALANHPRLVLADEPTGNLDRPNAREALELIRGACRRNGAALLIVSHDPDILAEFETVLPLARINRAATVESESSG